MIKIDSAVKLSFMFPAARPIAYEYYSDMGRLVQHLKYMDLVDSGPDNAYRMVYNTVELGTYHIHMVLDVRLDASEADHIVRILPIKREPAVKPKVTLNSTTTHGTYRGEARFFDYGEETRIEYEVRLRARPPRPKGMRFMPGRMVDKIARNITNHRMREIARSFIDSSIDAFPLWLAESAAA